MQDEVGCMVTYCFVAINLLVYGQRSYSKRLVHSQVKRAKEMGEAFLVKVLDIFILEIKSIIPSIQDTVFEGGDVDECCQYKDYSKQDKC